MGDGFLFLGFADAASVGVPELTASPSVFTTRPSDDGGITRAVVASLVCPEIRFIPTVHHFHQIGLTLRRCAD